MEGLRLLTFPARVSVRRVFLDFFLNRGYVLADWSPPSLEWLSFPPLVVSVLITPTGAEPPGRGRIGVIGALVVFPSEAV